MAGFNLGNSLKATVNSVKASANPNPMKSFRFMSDDLKQMVHPDAPEVPAMPGPPTVDATRIDNESADAIRRRRGRAGNVFAGNSSVPSSSLSVQQLLGG